MEKPGPGAQASRPPKLEDARSHWRTAIAFNVEVKQADTRNLKAQISDLSASGFKLECYFNLDVDKPVLIRIPGLSLIPA
uniref:PilZ domain-containing protein n=1 Tax=Parasphingorhabdus sp. TaxID=2709688 RepID=UPI003593EC05